MGNWYDPITSYFYGPSSEEAAPTPPAPKPAPEKPQQQEEESWYSSYLPSTDEVVKLASDAYTGLKNSAKVYSDKASDLYDYASKEVSEAADKAYTYAKEVYEENEEIIDAAAPIVLGPINGWIAKEAAEYVLGDDPEATPPSSTTEEPEQPVNEIYSDPKELLLSESTDPVKEAPDTTHARTVASNDTEETNYRSEPTDTESAPTTTAKTTVVYTAPQQPKTAQNVTTTPTTEIVEPVVVAQASTEATAQAARTVAPEPAKTETATNEVASSSQPATATVTSTPVVATTETQQTRNSDSGSSDSGKTTFASVSSGEGSNVSANSLAGIVSDPLGRTGQNLGTTSQSGNTATNSELAANTTSSASTVSNSSNKSTVSNNARTTADAKTQTSPEAVASTQPQPSADPRQQPLGVKLPGQDTQNDSGDTTAPTTSSNAALAAAVAAHFVRHDEGSSRLGTKKDDIAQAEGADKDSVKINGTGNPLENDSGSNQGNPFGNQAETVAALTDLENHFWGENEDYPIVPAIEAIFTSASQISTFG